MFKMFKIHAKLEVSSLNSYQDMEGPKILKVDHMTPSRPHLTYFWLFVASTPREEYSRQIWSF